MKLSTITIGTHRGIGVLTALGVCLLIALQDVTGDDPRETPGTVPAEDVEFTRLFELCVHRTGSDYIEASDDLLALGDDRLRRAVEALRTEKLDWAGKVTRELVVRWMEDASDCEDYHRNFKPWIKSSYGTVSGRPSVSSIAGFCMRDARTHPHRETLMLERLLKYDDPAHVGQGILKALGHVGTARSLDPLIAMMNPPEGAYDECIRSVGRISARLGDRRAVPHLAKIYHSHARNNGTGLPEEELRAMPPWPQRRIVSALRLIGGAKGLRALEELDADETHAALKEQIEKAIGLVREAIEETKKKEMSRTVREDPGDPESGDE